MPDSAKKEKNGKVKGAALSLGAQMISLGYLKNSSTRWKLSCFAGARGSR